jgi:hypothetical protein
MVYSVLIQKKIKRLEIGEVYEFDARVKCGAGSRKGVPDIFCG